MASLKRAAPGVRIAFLLPTPHRLGDALERGEIDMVVGVPSLAEEGLISRPIVQDGFLTAQRRSHPRGVRPFGLDEFCELEHVLISADGGGFTGQIDELLAEQGRERRVGVSIQSYALAPVILANTNYLCTLPRRFLMHFQSLLDLVEPPLDLGHFELRAMWHPRMKDDPGHRWFRNQVFEAVH